MPHLSWLACDPARCVNWAARDPDSSGRCHGGRAAWRAETMQIARDFSAADGFRRDAHIDNRREAQRQTRPRRRSKLHVAAQARTDACRLDGRPCAELAGRGSGGHRSHWPMKAGGGGGVASIWQREVRVQIQADGRAAWRAETLQIVCDFSAADGFRRDGHIDNRREAQRQTRPRRRSKLHVAAHARTWLEPTLVACSGRPSLR